MENMTQDYLVKESDRGVLQNLASMAARLKDLQIATIKAQEAYDRARQEQDYYASTILPMEMLNAGVDEIALADGGRMSVKREYHCNPNKGDADKMVIANWLKANGGEHLVKAEAKVDAAYVDKLKDDKIPYAETCNINTASLKAFIKGQLGVKGGVQQITMQDIPACAHFYESTTVVIDV
jgi:hypothetical protein